MSPRDTRRHAAISTWQALWSNIAQAGLREIHKTYNLNRIVPPASMRVLRGNAAAGIGIYDEVQWTVPMKAWMKFRVFRGSFQWRRITRLMRPTARVLFIREVIDPEPGKLLFPHGQGLLEAAGYPVLYQLAISMYWLDWNCQERSGVDPER